MGPVVESQSRKRASGLQLSRQFCFE